MNDILEVFFSPTDAAVEDKSGDKKIIWKDILREGEFPVTPGRKRKIPFSVVPTGQSSVTSDKITISMAELLKSYEDKAFESVTIPLRHPKPGEDTDVLNNAGYVEGLRLVKKDDKHYLQAGMGFTEPDVAGKVRRGTIPNVSSGIFFNFTRKSDDKTFPVALNHVCLTKVPVIDDLEPFQRVYASDDAIDNADDIEIEVIDLEDDDGGGNEKAEIVWNEQLSTKWIITEIRAQLSPDVPEVEGVPQMPRPYYEVLDVSREDTALVEEWFKGDRKRWVIPFTVGDNKVTISPATRWVEVREAMVAAADDFEERSYSKLVGRLSDALNLMLGDGVGKSYRVDQVTTDGRVSVKNVDDQSVFLAEFVEIGDVLLLSATSDWDRIGDPVPEEKPAPKRVVTFDTNTPEGRVAHARQQRRLLMSSHKSQ
jgi:hypothetical protein